MFRLKTFGGVALERDGLPLEGRATQRRRLALLAYLAAAGDRAVNREQLIALLWPERSETQARHSLSQVLYAIRADLDNDAVVAGVDELRLNGAVVTSDVGDFNRAVRDGDWAKAASVYYGAFLDGFVLDDAPEFEQWASRERERIARECGRAYEGIAAQCGRDGDASAAAAWWRKRAALDPLDARVALQLMHALVAAGDRTDALRQAKEHETLLRDELDSPADPSVAAFAARLRSEVGAPSREGTPAAAVEPGLREASPVDAAVDETIDRRSVPNPKPRRARWVATAVLAVAGILVTALGLQRFGDRVDGTRVIVLGDILGPDTSLALAVREVLQAELSGAPGIALVPDASVREARRLIGLGLDSLIAPHLVNEIAERQGAHAVLIGRATPLTDGAQLLVRLVDPRDGTLLYSATERPARDEDVVEAAAGLGRALRSRLGALAPDTSVRALPMVATVSLPALRLYALARRELAQYRRGEAIALAEAAAGEDDSFALAHYLAGDLLWFSDQQTRSDAHMRRAFELSARSPLRERLLIRARYEQLVMDRPDSALALWHTLVTAFPNDLLALEGMTWTLRLLGRGPEALAAARATVRAGPERSEPNLNVLVNMLIAMGDTTAARAVRSREGDGSAAADYEAEFAIAMIRRDHATADRWLDSIQKAAASRYLRYQRQLLLLTIGRTNDAADTIAILAHRRDQTTLSAQFVQALAFAHESRVQEARGLNRQMLATIRQADLSPPAIARLAERVAIVGALTGDVATLRATRDLLQARDAGRGLRSYRIARDGVDVAIAFTKGEFSAVSARLQTSLRETYHGRPTLSFKLLGADARVAAGDVATARRTYSGIAATRNDAEIGWVVASLAARRLAALSER